MMYREAVAVYGKVHERCYPWRCRQGLV